MHIPTEEQYLSALQIVKAYETHKEIIFQEKVQEVKKDLDEYFKNTEVKKYFIKLENWIGGKGVIIFPEEPYYDEDYGGQFDKALDKIGEKHGVKVKMDSGIYSK